MPVNTAERERNHSLRLLAINGANLPVRSYPFENATAAEQEAGAVGSAVGANPIAFIIPRHRVIPETGVVGNYRWDPIRKTRHDRLGISARSPLRAGVPYRIQANAA